MEEINKPLLKKVYHENCPGCKQDQINAARRRIPYVEFLQVWILVLSSVLPISSLFPFIYFMVRDFRISKRVEDIGFYAGFVGSSFMLGRALTSVAWGMAADRYGRKPVMLVGTLSVIVFNTLFGLSTNFWMAISMRFLLGFFNGLLGTTKAYVTEVGGEEHQVLGLSLMSSSWGIGLIFGPAVGGFLAQPAEKYPNLFSKNSIFGRFPYFLPCLCISLIAAASFLVCLMMPETLHFHGKEDKESHKNNEENGSQKPSSHRNLLKNWPLMSAIIVYCVFSLHDIAYTEVFSLWAESDRKYGGLSLTTVDVGEVLAISGFGLLLFQITLYPMIHKAFGTLMVSRVAAGLSLPLLASYPFLAKLSGLSLTLLLNCASLLKNILNVAIVTGLFVLQNNAVPQHQRGAANGISMTGMSLCRAVGPATGGALISWAQKRLHASFLPGTHMVFFVLNVVELLVLLLTFKPFLAMPEQKPVFLTLMVGSLRPKFTKSQRKLNNKNRKDIIMFK